MNFLDDLKKETTIGKTENNAVTYTSTLNKNLDFFAQAGAIRNRMEDARSMFRMAYSEDKEMALRNLSYLRDVREGLGEREAFRKMMHELIEQDNVVASRFLISLPELGRWDDLVDAYYHAKTSGNSLVAGSAIYLISKTLSEDIDNAKNGKEVTLLAKWLPSPSVSNKTRKKQANMIAHDLGFKVSKYRKLLSSLRKYIDIVETKLTERDYDNIDFEKLPSRALFKYRGAFQRNMEDEYNDFIDRVNSGEVEMNASNVLPYEIIRSYIDGIGWNLKIREYNPSLEATWKSLDNVIGEVEENAIVVADTSASMAGNPWYVAESLAIYCAERLNGVFKNHFITFSSKPELIELPDGGSLKSKMEEYHRHSIVSNTNLQATFDLILDTAVKNNTPHCELPSKIIIVSDMEFDQATASNLWWGDDIPPTNFEVAKEKFESKGYKLPEIVFWNVDSRNDNLPVRHNEDGVALVSGLTPNIFKSVLKDDLNNPETVMRNTLLVERYDFVKEILK